MDLTGTTLLAMGLASLVVVVGLTLVPPPRRLAVAVAFLVIWLPVGRYSELPVVSEIAAMTTVAPVVGIGWVATRYQGARQRTGWAGVAFVTLAIATFAFLVSTADAAQAMAIQTQWLMLVVVSVLVAQIVLADHVMMLGLLRGLAVGLLVAGVLAGAALVLDPDPMTTTSRFSPWGANPNQIAEVFFVGVPTFLYMGSLSPKRRILWYLASVFAAFGVILVQSVTAAAMAALMSGIYFWVARSERGSSHRSARALLVLVVAAAGVVAAVNGRSDDGFPLSPVVREVGGGSTAFEAVVVYRFEIYTGYYELIWERPLAGLLTTQGEQSRVASEVSTFSHSGYLQMAYMGGLLLAGPYVILCLLTFWSIWRLARRSRSWPPGPHRQTAALLLGLTAGAQVHGWVNVMVFHPTYVWAFCFVLLTLMVLAPARSSRGLPGGLDPDQPRLPTVGSRADAPARNGTIR